MRINFIFFRKKWDNCFKYLKCSENVRVFPNDEALKLTNNDSLAVMLQCCESVREVMKLIIPSSDFDEDTSWSVLKPIKLEEGYKIQKNN